MELMVGFVLSSIVITFTYFGIQLMMKTKYAIETEQNKVIEQSILYTVLTQDFFDANKITGDESNLSFYGDNTVIKYQFTDTLIIRESEKRDTIYNGDYEKELKLVLGRELLSSLKINIDSVSYSFSKEYNLKMKLEK